MCHVVSYSISLPGHPVSISEGHDRDVLTLPGMQLQLMQQVKKAMSSSTPLIVVLMSGGPVDISWAKVS